MTAEMIETLRASYANIQGIDPASPTYTKLCRTLDEATTETLTQIADAKIKFVSALAFNRVLKRKRA